MVQILVVFAGQICEGNADAGAPVIVRALGHRKSNPVLSRFDARFWSYSTKIEYISYNNAFPNGQIHTVNTKQYLATIAKV